MDNWKFRQKGMVCSTCVFFVEKHRELKDVSELGKNEIKSVVGRCRRNAPTMKGFPVVYDNDWCGDHRLDENKV